MRLAFISTRLAGTDGVSLETAKLAVVLAGLGHECFYCAGELDQHLPGQEIPEMHFQHPNAVALGQRAFGTDAPDPTLATDLAAAATTLKPLIRHFLQKTSQVLCQTNIPFALTDESAWLASSVC